MNRERRINMRRLGRRLADLRQHRDLTQRALADRLGVASSDVSRWEQGKKHLYADDLPWIAETLGVHPMAFFAPETTYSPRQIAAEHLAHSWDLLPPEERSFLELLLDLRQRMAPPWPAPAAPTDREPSSSAKTDVSSAS